MKYLLQHSHTKSRMNVCQTNIYFTDNCSCQNGNMSNGFLQEKKFVLEDNMKWELVFIHYK